ncbi:MAG TPA: hypothetical protein VKX16_13150 [Chloroflexota bacterium]|nr:hypothetical protein [Chloroflexota bacterium]
MIANNSTTTNGKIDEATAAAEQLLSLLAGLSGEEVRRQSREQELLCKLAEIESSERDAIARIRRVREVVEAGGTPEELTELGELFEALAQQPGDLFILFRVSDEAHRIGSMLHALRAVAELAGEP